MAESSVVKLILQEEFNLYQTQSQKRETNSKKQLIKNMEVI